MKKLWKKQLKQTGKKAEKEEYENILVWRIKRVHPKIVVVNVGEKHRPTELTLALKTDMYSFLIKVVTSPAKKLKEWRPFVFTVDKKGYVKNVLPYKMWKERQEQKQDEGTLEDSEESERKKG